MLWRRIRSLSPATILVIGWSLFVVHAYPGLMGADSFAQLDDVRAGVFHDAHPPVMHAMWAVIDRIVAGPFGMLVLQSVTFVAGAFLIARRLASPRAAALCVVIVLLSPPVLAGMAVVCGHALLAGLLLLGAGLLLDDRPRSRAIGIGVLAIAAAVRYNAPAATLPVLILLAPRQWGARPAGRPWRRYAIVVAVWLATVGLAFGVAKLLVDREVATPSGDRIHEFGSAIGFTGEPLPIVTRAGQPIERLQAAEIQQAHGAVQRTTSRVVDAVSQTFLFRPWLYLVLAVALLVKLRDVRELRALLASGILLELSLLYDARGGDYRESHWLVTCALLAAAIAIAMRFSPSPLDTDGRAANSPPDRPRTAPPPDPT